MPKTQISITIAGAPKSGKTFVKAIIARAFANEGLHSQVFIEDEDDDLTEKLLQSNEVVLTALSDVDIELEEVSTRG